MPDNTQLREISETIAGLTAGELRLIVRNHPAIQARVSEIRKGERYGLPRVAVSEESLLDGRLRELTGRLVRGAMTQSELREFVELQTIRSELMKPERQRRFNRHWKQVAAARKRH